MKKALKIIKKTLLIICGVIFFTFAIIMTILLLYKNDFGVTQMGKTSLIIIGDEISSAKYKKGDLVLVDSKKVDKIIVDEEIFTYKLDADGKATVQVGKVGEVSATDNAIKFVNGDTYSMKFVIGSATNVYSNLGLVLSLIQSKWGFLFVVLVPSFLIFIWEFYALIVEIKYGKEEDEIAPSV